MSDSTPEVVASFQKYVNKISHGGRCSVPHPHKSEFFWAFIGCFCGIGAVTFLTYQKGIPVLVASLGASACLIYGAPSVPFSQPRNAIGGHLLSALIGAACYQILGNHWYVAAMSVGLAVGTMVITRTIHPPAGATALIGVVTQQGWLYPILPVGVGITILLIVGILVNNLSGRRQYPVYWW